MAFVDQLATKAGKRSLVQVKGSNEGKYFTPPQKAQALDSFALALGCQAIYAFIDFAGGALQSCASVRLATLRNLRRKRRLTMPGPTDTTFGSTTSRDAED